MQNSSYQSRLQSTTSHSQGSIDDRLNQCSSSQFNSINKIYQLHSIINQLLIQKDKNLIAHTSLIQQNNYLRSQFQKKTSELEKQVTQSKNKVKQKQRSIEGLNMLIQEQRNKLTRIQAQRDQLQKLLDSVPKQMNKSYSVSLLVADYQKVKVDTQNKQTQIKKLNEQNGILSAKLIELSAENKSIRQNCEQQIKLTREKIQKQKEMFRQELKKYKDQQQLHINSYIKCIAQMRQQIRQLQRQRNGMEKKMQGYRMTIHQMHQLQLQNQIIRANDNSKDLGYASENSRTLHKLEQLKQNYNVLLQQNQRINQQNIAKLGQTVYYRSLCDKYTNQIQQLKIKLNNSKQIEYKMQNYLTKLQSQDIKRLNQDQPKDHLAKLQQILLQHSSEKKSYQHDLSQFIRIRSYLQGRIQQKQKDQKSLQQRINTQQEVISTLQHNSLYLTNKITSLQSQNSKLKLQIEKLSLNYHELQMKSRQSASPIKDNKNLIQVSSQKYYNLKQGILALGAQKTKLIKENIAVRSQMQQIQQEMVKRIKQFNSLSFQLYENKKRQQKWKSQKQQLYQRIKKLEYKIERNSKEYLEEKKQLQSKIDILKECVDKIKKQAQVSIQRNNKKSQNIYLVRKVYQLTLQPSKQLKQNQRYRVQAIPQSIISKDINLRLQQQKKIKTQKEKISALSLKNQIRQVKRNGISHRQQKIQLNTQLNLRLKANLDNIQQSKGRKQRFYTDRLMLPKQQRPKQRISSKDAKSIDYKKLDKIIKQLKRQNRQLSEENLY